MMSLNQPLPSLVYLELAVVVGVDGVAAVVAAVDFVVVAFADVVVVVAFADVAAVDGVAVDGVVVDGVVGYATGCLCSADSFCSCSSFSS